jgi:hypothetical protein
MSHIYDRTRNFDMVEEVSTVGNFELKALNRYCHLNLFSESQPLPEDLIQLWGGYQFMHSCEWIWFRGKKLEVTWADRDHYCQILSQTSPSLIRILRAIRFIPLYSNISGILCRIHFLMDISWDELRTVICSLCRAQCEEPIRNLLIVTSDPTHFPVPFDSIMWALGSGSLRVMQQILRGEIDRNKCRRNI